MPILYKVGGRSWGGTNGFQPIMQGTVNPSPAGIKSCNGRIYDPTLPNLRKKAQFTIKAYGTQIRFAFLM